MSLSVPAVDASRERSSEAKRPGGYERFYGFDERPFTLSTDPLFLYHSAAFDGAAQAMLDAIRRRDGIVMLTGELGIGKTTLCRAVMEQLDRRTITSLVTEPFFLPEDLLRTVLVDFGVISQADRLASRLMQASLADLLTALRHFLDSLAPLDAFAVVIIDEAHSLSVDQLKHVLAVADTGADKQLLQLMLVGRTALATTLQKHALRSLSQRVSTRAVLGPLKREELADYVTCSLQAAGPNARIEFASEALDQLHALSHGVPRVVNLLCDRALSRGARERARTIDERLVGVAGETLELARRSRTRLPARSTVIGAGFALLILIGALVGALVFRSSLAALMERWQARPAAPTASQPEGAPTMTLPPTPPKT